MRMSVFWLDDDRARPATSHHVLRLHRRPLNAPHGTGCRGRSGRHLHLGPDHRQRAGLNPARAIGPLIVAGKFTDWWVYVTAPLLGATVAATLYDKALRTGARPERA
jgi:major intrinsic protein